MSFRDSQALLAHPSSFTKEKSRSLIDAEEAERPVLDRRSVWGLYCMYAIVGIINGFIQNYIALPICQYVFGPMGAPGRATVQQCNIAPSITQMPWSFKLFYGIILDRVGFFGTRRRGWICFGWTVSLCIVGVMAFIAEDLAESGNFAVYSMLWLIGCCFYIFSDVAGDGMTIELSKLESEESRGWILTTGQMVRFSTMIMTNAFCLLAINGKDYGPPSVPGQTNNTMFPFELKFGQLHIALVALCFPFWLGMVCLLRDPPARTVEEHHSLGTVFKTLWNLMKTKIMFFLVIYALGNMTFAALQNPALNVIQAIAGPSTLQMSVGSLCGNCLFLTGVWIFRKYLMSKSWRYTFVMTAIMTSTNSVFQLLVIYNAWGIAQSGWFYALGSNIVLISQGMAQVLSSLAIVEISPAGFEATVYELLTTLYNSGITLNANVQNIFVPIFSLGDITRNSYFPSPTNPHPPQDVYNSNLAGSTYFTIATNILATLIICLFTPNGKNQCKVWLEDVRFHRTFVGMMALTMGGCAFAFTLTVSFLSLFPSTNCLKICGGSGCPA